MASPSNWALSISCILTAILCNDVIAASADLESGNSTHVGDFSKDNPLNKVLEKAENTTNIEDKERTYIFKKNGEVFHESVEDHRDPHKGRMEQVIEAWQARKEVIEGMLEAMRNETGGFNGSISDIIDPDLDSEVNYQNLIDDVKNELGNETFHDPDVEEAQHNTNSTMSGNPDEITRRKRLMEMSDYRRWPKGIVPYVILEEVKGNTDEYERAMSVYEEKTCIRFVPWVDASTNEDLDLGHPGRVNFVRADGCWSYQGNMRWSGGQSVSCCGGTACVHELGHALGSAHEHASDKRDGWIRVNPENIWPDSRLWYGRIKDDSMLTWGYDLSSTMHYQTWGFSSGGPTMTLLFPELYIGDSDYYMFMEISETHKCAEMEQCANFPLTCENDGYMTIVRGKCACRCPTGLDPETGCSTPIQVPANLKMPSGQYALPKLKTGCPGEGDFKDGEVTHVGEWRGSESNPFSLDGTFSTDKATHTFCTRDAGTFESDPDFPETSDWPGGSYCILRKGGQCPLGFRPGFIHYTDVESEEASRSGTLPDGVFTKNETRFELCCQFSGFSFNPIVMPVDKPFALFSVGWSCQEMVGMHHRKEEYGFDAVDVQFEGHFGRWLSSHNNYLYTHYCVYEPADMNCGEVITLDSSKLTTFIEINGTGRTDLECTWVVKGPNEDGTLVLEFDEFDVRQAGDRCTDTVEVRHSRIAQKGLIYCGQNDRQSIRSIEDKIMIRFSTYGADSTSAFKAYVRWVPNSELCYDVNDKGVSYSGKVNYTRKFEPCLPWAEVTECPHHPWNHGDEQDNLEGNYCRNPDNSFRPWCYTAHDGCQRNYCDVCSLEEPFNREENCDQLRKDGLCTDDVAQATHKCACECNDLLPASDPIQKFTDIRCKPPTAPVDGVLVEDLKDEYSLGEKVSYKCQNRADVFTKTCMSSGDWSSLGFVCVACPLNSIVSNNFCHVLLDEQSDYFSAKTKCQAMGGSLPMPKTSEENEAITSAAQSQGIWLGITDLETEGTFVRDDGVPQGYENWNDGEPNNWGGYEHCTVIKSSGVWNDYPCTYNAPIMCTVPEITDLPCVDFLEHRCPDLLEGKPSMCVDYPGFAEEFCAKTCGVCGSDGVTCTATPSSPDVEATSDVINVGEYANYSCVGDTYRKSGSLMRGCKSDGTLTGDEHVCKAVAESTISIGLPTLEKQPRVIPMSVAFTGENDLWTITHKGLITAWEYYSNSPMQTAFMVWRVEQTEKKYKLIGKNVVQTGNDDMERYEVPVEERIAVEKGDIIGIWNAAEGGIHFKECDAEINPGYARVSWGTTTSDVNNFKVGSVESFTADGGCCEFAFRAELALSD